MRYDTVFRQPRGHRLKKFCKTWVVAFVREASQTPPYRLATPREGAGRGRGGAGGKNGKRKTKRDQRGTLGDKITSGVSLSLSFSPSLEIEPRIFRVASHLPRSGLESRACSRSLGPGGVPGDPTKTTRYLAGKGASSAVTRRHDTREGVRRTTVRREIGLVP